MSDFKEVGRAMKQPEIDYILAKTDMVKMYITDLQKIITSNSRSDEDLMVAIKILIEICDSIEKHALDTLDKMIDKS